MIFRTKMPNCVATVSNLIRALKVPVSLSTIKTDLKDHPDYPSLLSVTDCLNAWNVPNEVFRINKSEFHSKKIPVPFIAHITDPTSQFILVKKNSNGTVTYSNEDATNTVITEREFLEKWDGIILCAEKHELSGEANRNSILLRDFFDKLSVPLIIIIAIFCIVTSVNYANIKWQPASLLLLKLAGITISILLVTSSLNSANPWIKNLCSLGKKNGCNAILKSDAANITSWLSWSEIGLFYFSGSFICLLLNPSSVIILGWISFCCLPYTIYSISYQIKLKNWCILCCTIQALLWLEATVFIFNGQLDLENSTNELTLLNLLNYSICFIAPIAFWGFLKPFITRANQIDPLKQQLKKFKYNTALFQQLLTSQKRYILPDHLMPIILGNPNSENVITVVSNPYCGPCASAHKILDKWIKERDDIQLKILFTTTNHDNDKQAIIARHVTALSVIGDKKQLEDALNAWYNQSHKKYEDWADKYPTDLNVDINEILKQQREWCEVSDISYTPMIMINGYKLIDPYRLDDIKYLLN